MAEIRAILYDMDGVLVQARDWHYEALNKALVEFGYTAIGYDDHLKRFDGLPTRKKLSLMPSVPQAKYEEINRAKQRHTLSIIAERCVPSTPHTQALAKLKAEGYRQALCSNSVRDSIHLILEKTGLGPYFEFYLSYEDVRAPKPDPIIYTTAMQRMGVTPTETLILEDNPNGLKSAYASRAHVMEVQAVEDVTYETIRAHLSRLEGKA
jgi:beta-phosphoglucomutase